MANTPDENYTSPRRWWLRLSRLLWQQRGLIWITIILGLGISAFATWLFTPWGTDYTKLPIGWVAKNPVLILLVGICLLLLTGLVGAVSHLGENHLHRDASLTLMQQSRNAFIRALHSQYTKELSQSLHGVVLFTLNLHEKFDLTYSLAQSVFQRVDHAEHPLPLGTTILQAYDDAEGGLLILGEPGAGKTTLLIDLACGLLDRAKLEPTHQIPVILNLSSWATKKLSLATWVVEELVLRYNVPRRLSQAWIQGDQLLLLLDGLDEVAEAVRPACIKAINLYRGEHFVPLIVCCRNQEYLSLQERLTLPSAVIIQPLTHEQVNEYLKQSGRPMAAVRAVLRTNRVLQELVTTPLMLNTVMLAYRGKSPKDLPQMGSAEKQQQQIFASYVTRMLEQRETQEHYLSKQILHLLSWLAQQMKRHSQSVFFVEQLQMDWVTSRRQRQSYLRLAVVFPGILIGALVSLIVNTWLYAPIDAADTLSLVPYVLVGGLVGGLLSGVRESMFPNTEQRGNVWKRIRRSFAPALAIGEFIGLGVGLSLWPIFGQPDSSGFSDWPYIFDAVIKYGVGSMLLSLLMLSGLLNTKSKETSEINSDTTQWISFWPRLIKANHLRIGLFVGLSFGLGSLLSVVSEYRRGFELSSIISNLFLSGLDDALSYGLVGVIVSVLLIGMTGAIQPTEILVWSWRRLGSSLMRMRHLKNTLIVGLSYVLIVGLGDVISAVVGNAGVNITMEGGVPLGLPYGLYQGLGRMLMDLLTALIIGLAYWLLIGLFQGVSSDTFNEHQRLAPNQGIHRSARNGLRLGLISAGICGLLNILSGESHIDLMYTVKFNLTIMGTMPPPEVWHFAALINALIIGLIGGLLAGLLGGGLAWYQHYILRFLLWRSGSIPWNYPYFLDGAARRVLLLKIGGGYRFIHPLFLDYFASLDTISPPQHEATQAQQMPVIPTSSNPSEMA